MENRKKESEDARNEDEMSYGLYRSSRHTSNSLSFFLQEGEKRQEKDSVYLFCGSSFPPFSPLSLPLSLSLYFLFWNFAILIPSPSSKKEREGNGNGDEKSHDKHVQEQQLELERNSVAISIPFYLHISPLLFSCLFTLIPVNSLGECLSLMRDRHICEWMRKLIVERKEDKIVKMFSQLNDPSSERRVSKTVSQGATKDKMIVMNMRSEKREFNTRSSWMRGGKENYRVEIVYPSVWEREGGRKALFKWSCPIYRHSPFSFSWQFANLEILDKIE